VVRSAWYWLLNTVSLMRAGYTYAEVKEARRQAKELYADEEFDWDDEENFGERPY
jgi:hypothetical protein